MILKNIFIYKCDNFKRMLLRLRGKLIILIFLSAFIFTPIQIHAEEDHLIIRVIDANYPPSMPVYDRYNYTSFIFTLKYQIENPTQSSIKVTYGCSIFPYPRLKTNLVNKSLVVEQFTIIVFTSGEKFINPGVKNRSFEYIFDIYDYENKSLPHGTYELWFDYGYCSSVPVPVVTERMFIYVNETSIIYHFEFNNETRIVSSLDQTANPIFFPLAFFFLIIAICKFRKRRRISSLLHN